MNKGQEAHQKLIEHMSKLGDMAMIKPVTHIECKKCGKIEIEAGTVIAPMGLFDDQTPPTVQVILPCPKCGRAIVAETEVPVGMEDLN